MKQNDFDSIEQERLFNELKRILFEEDFEDDDPLAAERESEKNSTQVSKTNEQTVIVCFGTPSISGDSLGPQVGSILRDKLNVPAFVYGVDETSINGKNMYEWLEFIKSVHKGATFVAVDASLGQADKVGQIVIRDDGVCPAAIKGKKERFGDVGVLAVVAENKGDALMQLMSVSKLYVAKLADKLANMIYAAIA